MNSPLALKLPCRIAALALFAFFAVSLFAAEPPANAATTGAYVPDLGALRPHPRLLVSPDSWKQIRERAAADPAYRALVDQALTTARARLSAPPPERTLTGMRLLFVSRRVLADAVWFSLAYRITGERVFLDTAERNLLAAAAFSDWNPAHFLDVAEMSAGVALGYDWLNKDLSPATRTKLREALVQKGIRTALDPVSKHNWWHLRDNNWNQVCLGGLTLAALAVADDEPALARASLDLLARRHGNGLGPYSPDGIYPEGSYYWRYGSSYTVLTLAALKSALGTEAPYGNLSAFFASARVQNRLLAPSGDFFGFGDSSLRAGPEPLLFWFAHRLDDPGLLASQVRHFLPFVPPSTPDRFGIENLFALLHWQAPVGTASTAWSAWLGQGSVPLAIFRGPDRPSGTYYLAVKGGSPGDSHGHMDSGSFVLEIDGVRWAEELGGQDYTKLEAAGIMLFDQKQNGDRWRIFRLTNFAHNTLTLGSALHRVDGRATLQDFSADPATLSVTADLKPVLSAGLDHALRRYQPRSDGLGLDITDALAGLTPKTEATWTLVTSATITLDGNEARLAKGGRRLAVRLLDAPPGARAEVASATGPADFDALAPKHRLLRFHVPAPADGRLLLRVRLETLPSLSAPVP